MSDHITIEAIGTIPLINEDDSISQVLLESMARSGQEFAENDIVCVASKVVSLTEHREVSLEGITPSAIAERIHQQIPRKDARTVQLMIEATGQEDDSRIEITGNHIAGWLPNGLRLTSAGIDKVEGDKVILLPEDSDASARAIGTAILNETGLNVGIIITDSDGRVDKKGATQIAIGTYGVPPLRKTTVMKAGKETISEETLCDMLAASAALIMGQRGTNKPAVIIRGVDYEFSPDAAITDALTAR